jgi:hypothetical protein
LNPAFSQQVTVGGLPTVPPPSLRKPRPTEPLWTLCKGDQQTDAALLGHGEYGWELRLLRQGDFYGGRRFDLREQAVAFGSEIRRELEADGWCSPE